LVLLSDFFPVLWFMLPVLVPIMQTSPSEPLYLDLQPSKVLSEEN